jgi:hypothetical protein
VDATSHLDVLDRIRREDLPTRAMLLAGSSNEDELLEALQLRNHGRVRGERRNSPGLYRRRDPGGPRQAASHSAVVFVTNEQMPLKSASHASGEKGKPFSPQIWLISAHTGHIPVQRPLSGGKTTFPLDMGRIWKNGP